MTFKDINQKFTEAVAEYMARGYTLNAGTMAGSQGEIGSVDLTDGNEIIRIMVDRFMDGGVFGFEGVEVVVGRSTDRVLPNDKGGLESTIWNSALEILSEEKFYQINHEDNWYGTKEQAEAAREKQHERYANNEHFRFGWDREKDLTSDDAIDIVLPFIRRELGLKRVRRSEIEIWKYRKDDRRQYRVLYGAKVLVLE